MAHFSFLELMGSWMNNAARNGFEEWSGFPPECPLLIVSSDHPWREWHGDIVVAVDVPRRAFDGQTSRIIGTIEVAGNWNGVIPLHGLLPLTPAGAELLNARNAS